MTEKVYPSERFVEVIMRDGPACIAQISSLMKKRPDLWNEGTQKTAEPIPATPKEM